MTLGIWALGKLFVAAERAVAENSPWIVVEDDQPRGGDGSGDGA